MRKEQVKPCYRTLTTWNKSTIHVAGETRLDIVNIKSNDVCPVNFLVVNNDLQCLLGLDTVRRMNLVTVNSDAFIATVTNDNLGHLGYASLTVDPSVKPRILPCRRLPVAICDKVKAELDTLVDKGVLAPISEPTQWVSQMAVVNKKNGSLRICIDPQPLNTVLKREHFKLPTLDDILPELHNAKVFSKLDVKHAYWHVELDDISSKLTTMITPFGRYRWKRLPFGLKVSSEIFQRKLNDTIFDLPGVFAVADDVIVIGRGATHENALIDHDANLHKLHERCREKHIMLNDEKADMRMTEITFMGHLITKEGIQADPNKITAIRDMPSPTDVHGVKRFCGMIQYLARFMPNLAQMSEPLRHLTKKGIAWNWSPECENALQAIKQAISQPPVLAFYNQNSELVLQVDSSKDGIGAVLLQNDQPIEYIFRALTKTERNWAQIEKELLLVVFGLERFDQYTYGRKVLIHNDHRPLETILKKPLSQAPKRLQTLSMRINRYNIEFAYVPGSALLLADTLSRAYPELDNTRHRIAQFSADPVCEEIHDETLLAVAQATISDEESQLLLSVIKNGWPDDKSSLHTLIKPYFAIRDTLSFDNYVIMKGERIFIPKCLRLFMKARLHAAHTGADSMIRRAKETIFWLGMPNELRQLAQFCSICQRSKPCNVQEPLLLHAESSYPFEKVGVDIFDLNGKHYLVTVDYFSNFAEIDVMPTISSRDVIIALKRHFCRYGIPKCLISDCGRQFVSDEFKSFCNKWSILHLTSSPGHQQSNGKAEAAVKTYKTMLMRTSQQHEDQWLALLEIRNTPRQDILASPANIMFGRSTRTVIPVITKKSADFDFERRRKHRNTVKLSRDKCTPTKSLSPLHFNQNVYFQSPNKEGWQSGKVVETLSAQARSYVIQTENGSRYRRNRVHIRPNHSRAVQSGDVDIYDYVSPTVPFPDTNNPATTARQAHRNLQACSSSNRSRRIRKQPIWFRDYET